MAKIFYSLAANSGDDIIVETSSILRIKEGMIHVPLHSFDIKDINEEAEAIRKYLKHNVDLFVNDLLKQGPNPIGGVHITKERE